MGNTFAVEVVTLFDRTAEIGAAMEKRLDQASEQGAERVASRASGIAPRRTGEEASSFEVTKEADGYHVTNTAPYFPYVELGTHKMAAEPSLGPAGREEAKTFEGEAAKAVEEVVAL